MKTKEELKNIETTIKTCGRLTEYQKRFITQAFIDINIQFDEYKKEVEKIIDSLSEYRGLNNGLIGITLDDEYATNSVEILKEILKQKIKELK